MVGIYSPADGTTGLPRPRDEYVIPRLTRRLSRAVEADENGTTLYLEHGEPVLGA
jgi:hypothetical protein